MIRALFIVAALAIVVATAQSCDYIGNPGAEAAFQNEDCPFDKPYCRLVGDADSAGGFCLPCDPSHDGWAPCSCDPATSYCGRQTVLAGSCEPYTILDRACSKDDDCVTYVDSVVAIEPEVVIESVVDQRLYCVNDVCKPVTAKQWKKTYGDIGETYTCPGYDERASNELGRYAVATMRPGTSFTLTDEGDVQVIDSTIDYNYGFPGGDRSQWQPSNDTGKDGAASAMIANVWLATLAAIALITVA